MISENKIMAHTINIEGIKVYAYHGCLEEEAKIGGNYIVDVHMRTDFSKAAQSDELLETIDYCTVYEIVKKEMKLRSKLIEHVAERIFRALKAEFPALLGLHVKVIKLLPPMNGDVERVSVEIAD